MAADARRQVTLFGLEVTDDAGYARYREAMAPILARHGGAFGCDFVVARVLCSGRARASIACSRSCFRTPEVATGSSRTRAYRAVRKQWFEPSVGMVATLGEGGLTAQRHYHRIWPEGLYRHADHPLPSSHREHLRRCPPTSRERRRFQPPDQSTLKKIRYGATHQLAVGRDPDALQLGHDAAAQDASQEARFGEPSPHRGASLSPDSRVCGNEFENVFRDPRLRPATTRPSRLTRTRQLGEPATQASASHAPPKRLPPLQLLVALHHEPQQQERLALLRKLSMSCKTAVAFPFCVMRIGLRS